MPLLDINLQDNACGKRIATIPANTILTPLYVYTQVLTCTQMSAIPVAAQKAIFDRNQARDQAIATSKGKPFTPAQFSKRLPYRNEWFTQVTFGTTNGWVSTDRVVKVRCDKSAVTCPFTAVNPSTCFRVTQPASKPILDGPCGKPLNGGLKAQFQDIMVTSAATTTATPASCQGTWLHVTFNGIDGYTLSTGTTSFACNGDGWLKQVGPFVVIKDDKSRLAETGAHTNAPNKFLVHTVEGAWPSPGDYPNGALNSAKDWPNFIVSRKAGGAVVVAQYYSIYSWSRSLVSHNLDGVVQVETGARADNPFTEKDWIIALTIRALYRAVAAVTGIPLCKDSRILFRDIAVPDATIRLNDADWLDVHGLCGHQHNPQPPPPLPGQKIKKESHWDPGQIDPFKLTT